MICVFVNISPSNVVFHHSRLEGVRGIIGDKFLYFHNRKMYVVTSHKNRLNEMVLLAVLLSFP